MLSGEMFIPETITVHLGLPDSEAANVTIPYISYLKNVASSEIFPTWPENALRANIYAINTYALNRIYTEWYRSRGYPFDITSTTQYDQAFVYGREIFGNISQLAEALVRSYIRRQGSVEPLFAAFCDGSRTTCAGLSQWGTVSLANQGYTPYEILQYFYGSDIDLVRAPEIRAATPSYPGVPQETGMVGNDVQTIQIQLNRISQNFPAIPKVASDGVYDDHTARAVRVFQEVFSLEPTGTVNEPTWYRLSYIYTSVKRLAELESEGLTFEETQRRFPNVLREGDFGHAVRSMQYYLAVVGAYYNVAPKKEMNKIGIAAALMYALSTLLKYITASLAYEGVSLYGSSARLIQSGDGFIVLFIAALAAVAAFSGSNKGFLGAGVVAFGFMIFQVVNYDNKARDLMKMWRDVAGSDSVKLVIDKEIGFWMLVLSATALLAVGVISVLTEKKSF